MHFDQAGREPGYVTPNTQKTEFSSNTRCVHLYVCVHVCLYAHMHYEHLCSENNSLYLFCDFRVDFIFSSPCYVSHALVAAFVVVIALRSAIGVLFIFCFTTLTSTFFCFSILL
uniref:Uncharacterized protein n=1 Tax=Glossina palpalis gambiensis TaxID=67801 RepID=A0A1B0AZW0_9MUSC